MREIFKFMSLIKRRYKLSIRAKQLECEISEVDISLLYQEGKYEVSV
jgi:hypothetical protein